jgi:hypothetical protein
VCVHNYSNLILPVHCYALFVVFLTVIEIMVPLEFVGTSGCMIDLL